MADPAAADAAAPDRAEGDAGGSDTALAGRRIIGLSWAGTILYVLVAAAAMVAPEAAQAALILVCVGLFLAGAVAFLAAYAIAVGRSRYDAIGMGGLFFLAGSAPAPVQRHLLGSFSVELLAAVVSASVGLAVLPGDADNPLAFGILTPLYGLGLAGLWGARHGRFPPRQAPTGDRGGPASGVAGGREGPG